MLEQVRALGIVSLVRSLLELLAGFYLLLVVAIWSPPAYPETILAPGTDRPDESVVVETATNWLGNHFARLHPSGEPESGDRGAFAIIGGLLVLFGVVRSVQSSWTLLCRNWARKCGLFLAAFDLITPVTLPLALWGLFVYRHPETRDLFTRRGGRPNSARPVDRPVPLAVD